MDKTTARIISKVGFVLVIFGFFMPFVLDQNTFQIAEALMQLNQNTVAYAIYVVFFASCIGGVILVLILIKQKIDDKIDWGIIITAGIAMVIIISSIYDALSTLSSIGRSLSSIARSFGAQGAGSRAGSSILDSLQSGAFMIIIGILISVIFQFVSSDADEKKEKTPVKNNVNDDKEIVLERNEEIKIKKCKKCGKNLNEKFDFCSYCGANEFEKIINNKKKIKKICDKVYRDKDIWICGKCNTSNELELDNCKNCGKEYWPED